MRKNFLLPVFMTIFFGAWMLGGCSPRETAPMTLVDATSRVEGGLRVKRPDGQGPFPTVIYFHGASDFAWHDGQQAILDGFATEGFAAVFVDLYHGRGVNGPAVRSGALMPRAAARDVSIALDWAGRQSWAAPGRLGLFGLSFGATTIMDALVLDAPDRSLETARAAALLTPWCAKDIFGFNMIRAVHVDFARHIPMLAILPQADSASNQALCQAILQRNQARGAPIEVVSVAGAGHNFALENDDYGNAFEDYDAAKSKAAWQRIYTFFRTRLE